MRFSAPPFFRAGSADSSVSSVSSVSASSSGSSSASSGATFSGMTATCWSSSRIGRA